MDCLDRLFRGQHLYACMHGSNARHMARDRCTRSTHLVLSFAFFLSSKNSNSMAFISQFGEYNPGGGKDQVLKYLLEAETNVKLAKTSLKVIIDALEQQ
jgi:hypothetical protein